MNLFGWQNKYYEHFHDYFPSYLFSGDEAIKVIKNCLKKDEPYQVKPDTSKVY